MHFMFSTKSLAYGGVHLPNWVTCLCVVCRLTARIDWRRPASLWTQWRCRTLSFMLLWELHYRVFFAWSAYNERIVRMSCLSICKSHAPRNADWISRKFGPGVHTESCHVKLIFVSVQYNPYFTWRWNWNLRSLKSLIVHIFSTWHQRWTSLILLWLLLRGGIVQSVLGFATILWYIVRPHLTSSYCWLIHQSFLTNTSRHPVSNQEKLGEKSPWILPTRTSFILQVPLTCHKILPYEGDLFISPPKRSRATDFYRT
jgi:hypothetical protein